MRFIVIAAAIVAAPAFAADARADEVFLLNGQSIAGRVESESEREVVLAVKGGTIRLARREVIEIERGPLPEDLYAERAATTDLDDPAAVRGLAGHARDLGLRDVADKLDRTASEVELDAMVAKVKPGDAAGFRAAARFARERGLGRAAERFLFERALEADPKDREARYALDAIAELERIEKDDERRRAELDAERQRLELELERARIAAARLREEVEREREARVAAEYAQRAAEMYAEDMSNRPAIVIVQGNGPRVRGGQVGASRRSGPPPSSRTTPAGGRTGR